ncbi:MAG: hypothetical protein GXP30_05515 [Verrucomicrobia bacterium]|nr:hypothetical protein [Verrucomicrobiota bacterium]
MKLLSGTLTLLAGAVMLLSNTSCATSSDRSPSAITKVKYFHLDPVNRVRTFDRMISFDQGYHRYGAVDNQQLQEKTGHYYSVFWKTEDRTANVKLRMDYRHQSTGPKEYSFEIDVDKIRRRNVTKFAVVGEDYLTLGPVTAWKITLMVNGEIAGENKSFLWK